MSTRTKLARKGIIWGILNKIITMVMEFIKRTLLIYILGIEYVGLDSLFVSVLSVLSFAELGVGSAIVFSMYQPVAEKDIKKTNALLNFYRKCYICIGIIVLCLGAAVFPFLDYFIKGDVPDAINIKLLFSIYLFNSVISYFLYAHKTSLYFAEQQLARYNQIRTIILVFFSCFQIVLFLVNKNYYLYSMFIPLISSITSLSMGYCTKREFPHYKCEGKISKQDIQDITKNIGGMLCYKIGNIVISSADTIVISSFLGLKLLGVYNGYNYIMTALFAFIAEISRVIIPSVGNSIVSESVEKNYRDFCKFHFLFIWMITWCSACLLCLYQPFIKFWQGTGNMLEFPVVVFLVFSFYIHKMGDIYYIYREATGLWWRGKIVPILSAVCNVICNLVLVRMIGVAGVILATIISMAILNIPMGSWYLFKYYFKSINKWMDYMKNMFLFLLVAVVIDAITFGICILIKHDGVVEIIYKGCICCLVPNIIFVLIHRNNPDFKEAYLWAKNVIKSKI